MFKVVDTRWTTWLRAVNFHYLIFDTIKLVFYAEYFHKKTERENLINVLYQERDFKFQLTKIVHNYMILIDLTTISETDLFTVKNVYEMFKNLNFNSDLKN